MGFIYNNKDELVIMKNNISEVLSEVDSPLTKSIQVEAEVTSDDKSIPLVEVKEQFNKVSKTDINELKSMIVTMSKNALSVYNDIKGIIPDTTPKEHTSLGDKISGIVDDEIKELSSNIINNTKEIVTEVKNNLLGSEFDKLHDTLNKSYSKTVNNDVQGLIQKVSSDIIFLLKDVQKSLNNNVSKSIPNQDESPSIHIINRYMEQTKELINNIEKTVNNRELLIEVCSKSLKSFNKIKNNTKKKLDNLDAELVDDELVDDELVDHELVDDELINKSIEELDYGNVLHLFKIISINSKKLLIDIQKAISNNLEDDDSHDNVLKLTNTTKKIFNEIKEASIKHASEKNNSTELGSGIKEMLIQISSRGIKLFEEVKESADKIVEEKTINVEDTKDTKETEELVDKFISRINEILKDSKQIISKSFNNNSLINKSISKSIKEQLFLELDEPLDKNLVTKFKKVFKESLNIEKDKSMTEDVLFKSVDKLNLDGALYKVVKSIIGFVSLMLPSYIEDVDNKYSQIILPFTEIIMFFIKGIILKLPIDTNDTTPEFSPKMMTDLLNNKALDKTKTNNLINFIKYAGWINFKFVEISERVGMDNLNMSGLNSEHVNIFTNFKTKALSILKDTQLIFNKVNTNTNVIFKDISKSIKEQLKNNDTTKSFINLDDLSLTELILKLTKDITSEYTKLSKEIKGNTKYKNSVKDDDNTKDILLNITNEIVDRFNKTKNVLINNVSPVRKDGKITLNKIKGEILKNSVNAKPDFSFEEYLQERLVANRENPDSFITTFISLGVLIVHELMMTYIVEYEKPELNILEIEAIHEEHMDSILNNLIKMTALFMSVGINLVGGFNGDEISDETSAELLGIKRFYKAKNAHISRAETRVAFYELQKETILKADYDLPDPDLLRLAFYHLSDNDEMKFIEVKKVNNEIAEIVGYSMVVGETQTDYIKRNTPAYNISYSIYYDSTDKEKANKLGASKLKPLPKLSDRMTHPITKSANSIETDIETVNVLTADPESEAEPEPESETDSDSELDSDSDSDSESGYKNAVSYRKPMAGGLQKLLLGVGGLFVIKKII